MKIVARRVKGKIELLDNPVTMNSADVWNGLIRKVGGRYEELTGRLVTVWVDVTSEMTALLREQAEETTRQLNEDDSQ